MKEWKFNKRRKLDRFLATLPEDMVFKSNNEFRIKMPNGYISIGYYYHTYHAFGGHRNQVLFYYFEEKEKREELVLPSCQFSYQWTNYFKLIVTFLSVQNEALYSKITFFASFGTS